MGTATLKSDSAKIAGRHTFLCHTHLAVIRHAETVDWTALTSCRKYLGNIKNIVQVLPAAAYVLQPAVLSDG